MCYLPGRARAETVISIFLLVIIILIAAGVFVRQLQYDPGQSNSDRQVTDGLTWLLPSGFETMTQPESYDAESLYEKIDGKVGLYLGSGFIDLICRRFVNKDDENLWMELFVYDMGNNKNAFSVYSLQKRPDADMLSFSHPGYHYKTSNGLYFACGKYYVELVGSAESAELDNAMAKIAVKFASRIAVDGAEIAEIALFPKNKLVEGSIKLYLANVFGFEGLTETFTAQYDFDEETITAFFSKRSDLQSALNIAGNYYNFLLDNGAIAKQVSNKIDGLFKVFDFYGTTEIVFATGPFVAGVHQAENQQLAEKLAIELYNKLSETNKQ